MPGRRLIVRFVLLAGVGAAVAACSPPAPYAYKEFEFNRELPTFGEPAATAAGIQICYNKLSTTPEALQRMAADHCASLGKAARFAGQDYLECPLLTPARAAFDCVK